MTTETEVRILEDAPSYAEGVSALARWSGNYDYPTPYTLFLDLIGFNGEQFGEVQFTLGRDAKRENGQEPQVRLIDERLGYLELGMLADALKEYSDRPQEITEFCERIMNAGMEDDDDPNPDGTHPRGPMPDEDATKCGYCGWPKVDGMCTNPDFD